MDIDRGTRKGVKQVLLRWRTSNSTARRIREGVSTKAVSNEYKLRVLTCRLDAHLDQFLVETDRPKPLGFQPPPVRVRFKFQDHRWMPPLHHHDRPLRHHLISPLSSVTKIVLTSLTPELDQTVADQSVPRELPQYPSALNEHVLTGVKHKLAFRASMPHGRRGLGLRLGSCARPSGTLAPASSVSERGQLSRLLWSRPPTRCHVLHWV